MINRYKSIVNFKEFIKMSDIRKWKALIESASTIVENDTEDMAHTDHEVSMARSQLLSAVKSSTRIAKQLQDKSEEEGLEGWVASKLTMAEDYLQAVADHMDGQEINEGYKVMPPMDPKYVARSGLEGPFTTLSGKVVYYDPKEGKYYDPDTDIYMTYDEFQNYDKDYSGMKDERDEVKEEMSDEQIDAFHTALDALVHKHLGHSSDERDEVEETLSPEEKKQVNQMYNKDGTMTDIGKKVMSQGQIQDILKKAMKQLKGIDAEAKFTHRDLNQAVATINQGDIAGALQELVNGVDGPEPQIQDTFNDAHDDLQRLINPKTDKELDDEYQQELSDMKAKSRAGVESIVQDVLNNALEEMTSAGAIASVATPMGKMKRRKDSIFADKESNQTAISEAQFDEAAGEKDACYRKVKSRYKVWPSAYASGALTKCRKVGAANWGKSKK